MAFTHHGHAVGGVEALVGVHLAAGVGVGGNLPAAQIDGLESGLRHLHRLVAGQGAKGGNVRGAVHQIPQLFRSAARETVLHPYGATKLIYVFGAVRSW